MRYLPGAPHPPKTPLIGTSRFNQLNLLAPAFSLEAIGRIDVEANTGAALPDLSGLDLLPISTWEQKPGHALFGSQPEAFSLDLRPGPLTGLSLETGEPIPLMEDIALDSLVTHGTTADGDRR